ncbi:hypothetical protein QYE76_016126 [Lolium multiflorum]|uniref:Transposase (putative) gypsy type domain-containing protein n=1 Tax=Lolium multiflorum TaxID=4521 RepID=A0AAD8U7U4_LOLMU|nr:hypothetical protein QYE76_016126 [Lolium multiflorum]
MVSYETTDVELRELQNKGMISAHWSFIRDTVVPKPGAGEIVMTKAWVERGLSLPCSEFFLSILNTYGLQPHNIRPSSYLLLSNFATLCEGHLGIRPDVKLWQFFFRVKKETKDKAMLNWEHDVHAPTWPHVSSSRFHESVRYWNTGWFYEKNASLSFQLDTLAEEYFRAILRVPVSGDAAEEVPEDDEEEEEQAPRSGLNLRASPRQSFRLGRAAARASAKKPKITKPSAKLKAERERLKMLATAGKRSRPHHPGAPIPTYRYHPDHSQSPSPNT